MYTRRLFIRKLGWGAAGYGILSSVPVVGRAALNGGILELPRSTPEKQGISSSDILRFLDAIKESKQEFHSLMIVRHGQVVAEAWWAPYSSEHRQQLYSLSKSFTGTAIGLAISESKLKLDDTVISFFPGALPEQVSSNLSSLKIRHLLTMSVGHEKDAMPFLEHSAPGDTWEKTFLGLPVVYEPGSRFLYNSGASYMLSSIIKKVTGAPAHEYLRTRLYEPLNIEHATWTENDEGVNIGASHLRIRTEDIAKFGQLYLRQGVWNGRQVIPREWVNEASSKQIETGHQDSSWGYGYGYQFWMNPPGGFRADGAFGQFSMVLPALDAVVAITSESISTKDTMRVVWENLLPEMKDSPLPADKTAHRELTQRLKSLAYEPPKMAVQSPLAQSISGKEFLLEKNVFRARSVSFLFAGDKCLFTLKEYEKPEIIITGGMNYWIREGNLKPEPHSLFSLRRIDFDSIVAASATWKDDQTLVLTWRFIETVHGDTLTCIFSGDQLRIRFLFSVNRLQGKPDDRADILGKMVS